MADHEAGSQRVDRRARLAVPGDRHYDSIVFYFKMYATVYLFKAHSNNLPLIVNT
jgi:hypothetical protein